MMFTSEEIEREGGGGVAIWVKNSHVLRGRVSIGLFVRGVFYFYEGCSEDLCIFSFLSF